VGGAEAVADVLAQLPDVPAEALGTVIRGALTECPTAKDA
jgi:hypothetical protein